MLFILGMKVFDAIRSRRSVRNFKSDTLPPTVLARIMEAFRWAPTAGNISYLYAVIVENQKVRKGIADACIDQEWIYDAPAIIVVCSKTSDIEKTFGSKGKTYALQGSAAASQNVLLAAEELGVSGTWVGAYSESKIKKVLKMPQGIDIHNLIALGYARRIPKSPSKVPAHRTLKFDSWGSTVKGHKDIYAFWEPDAKRLGKKVSEKVGRIKKRLTKKK